MKSCPTKTPPKQCQIYRQSHSIHAIKLKCKNNNKENFGYHEEKDSERISKKMRGNTKRNQIFYSSTHISNLLRLPHENMVLEGINNRIKLILNSHFSPKMESFPT
ncbi:hypothetical protein F8M41_010999 [Gigaspora margarita]|uniref:Uncharacterized protein n=1 Tax=Gigaspora margarita TaxID=4874 RepID=A0A8H3WZS7_GIGMA|nr:hypothetical protein F8M41_010999 [Gigaspora margarita]